MGLIGNYSVLHKSPNRYLGGTVSSGDAANWNKPGMLRSRSVGLAGKQASIPLGFDDSSAWFYPRTVGGMVVRADGGGDLDANLVPTLAMAMDLTGAGSLSATAALAVSMIAAMAGDGALTANITGIVAASVSLSGAGNLNASMGAIADMLVDMIGQGSLAATIAAYGNMSVDIVVTGAGLTTSNVGEAVWSAIAAANNEPGTMGDLLNAAGGGGISGAVIDQIADAIWAWSETVTPGSKGDELAKALRAAKLAAALSA